MRRLEQHLAAATGNAPVLTFDGAEFTARVAGHEARGRDLRALLEALAGLVVGRRMDAPEGAETEEGIR